MRWDELHTRSHSHSHSRSFSSVLRVTSSSQTPLTHSRLASSAWPEVLPPPTPGQRPHVPALGNSENKDRGAPWRHPGTPPARLHSRTRTWHFKTLCLQPLRPLLATACATYRSYPRALNHSGARDHSSAPVLYPYSCISASSAGSKPSCSLTAIPAFPSSSPSPAPPS